MILRTTPPKKIVRFLRLGHEQAEVRRLTLDLDHDRDMERIRNGSAYYDAGVHMMVKEHAHRPFTAGAAGRQAGRVAAGRALVLPLLWQST